LTAAITLACLAFTPAVSLAGPCGPPVSNPIACENSLPGADPTTWEISGAGDSTIQGYATQISVNRGTTVTFKIKSATSGYHIDILRLGYYGGLGARLIAANLAPTGASTQPACLTNSTGLVDCGNWSASALWAVPATAVSGVYIAHLVRDDTGTSSHIVFVVRDDASTAPIVLQTSDAAWQAYNTYGGNSLYQCSTAACPNTHPTTYYNALKVSYNRPFHTAEDDNGRSWLFSGAEYPLIRWLEANGYDISYISGVDTDSRGAALLNHKLFISSGHDEYWSQNQRTNVEQARERGVNLAFFSGNLSFWKTRFEPSIDGTNAANRTLVSYKDTHLPQAERDPVAWTGTWRDSRYTVPPNRPVPENALTGLSFLVNSGTAGITVPFAYKDLRIWRNTAAASLTSGQALPLAASTLGYEWDVDADNGFRPPGTIRLSSTTVTGLEMFSDYGSSVTQNGTATHNLVMYRASSGARVFNSGSVQWAFGLDSFNSLGVTPDTNMRQATVNLLADLDAQPGTLQAGLVAAAKTTDGTPPTSTITAPAAGATLADGTAVTITGTAADAGGGVVAGVEVSTDGGANWHPASTGTSNWSYSWIAHGNPSTTILARATDDSGNIETPGSGRAVNVTCPCSLWGATAPAPPDQDSLDPNAAEIGVKFQSDYFGLITGIRFFKATKNTGTHTGSLWSSTGTLLAQATFTGETTSGWQTVTFSQPVEAQPNTTYVASYFAPQGHFAATSAYFYPQPAPGPNGGSMTDALPLHALRNSAAVLNGVFAYSGASAFPAASFGAGNYWVDVLFTPIAPPGQVANVTAASGGKTSANVSWSAPPSGGTVTGYTVTPRIDGVAQSPTVVSGSPPLTTTTVTGLTNGTTYTFTVAAFNPNGSAPDSPASNTVTPLTAVSPAPPTSVTAKPATQSALVAWTTPASDGDSPITSYTITAYGGSPAQTPVTTPAPATSATVSGLTNGVSYAFTVVANNAIGGGAASVASAAMTPEGTLFDFATPATPDAGDSNAVELGVKFTADVSGAVTGVRFYKSSANTGTHLGSLWATNGSRLAQATFTNESPSGWQTATFAAPVSIAAGVTYVASYFDPHGHYAASGGGLTASISNAQLRSVANGASPNGVYAYGAASVFPANSYNAGNYYVDPMFAVPVPGETTSVTATAAGRTSATVSWTAPTSGGTPASYSVTPQISGVPQAATTVTGSPLLTSATIAGLTNGTTYTFVVSAINASGSGPSSLPSPSVTPLTALPPAAPSGLIARPATQSAYLSWNVPSGDGDSPITGYTVTPFVGSAGQTPISVGSSATRVTVPNLTNGTTYTFTVAATNGVGTGAPSAASTAITPQNTILDFAAPGVLDAQDPNPVELGVKVTATANGSITGIRFYKAPLNVGPHTGSLWSSAGTRLAQATFVNETAGGWQTASFATPVAVTAGTTYLASYFAPNGHYSLTANGLATAITNGPLTAPADANSPDGVYAYGATSGFPSASFNASNYFVDILFKAGG